MLRRPIGARRAGSTPLTAVAGVKPLTAAPCVVHERGAAGGAESRAKDDEAAPVGRLHLGRERAYAAIGLLDRTRTTRRSPKPSATPIPSAPATTYRSVDESPLVVAVTLLLEAPAAAVLSSFALKYDTASEAGSGLVEAVASSFAWK